VPQAARIAAAYAADKAAALKAAEERIPEMRRKEEERTNKRRAERGLKPLPEPSVAVLSNGDVPHAEPAHADASEDKDVRTSSSLAVLAKHASQDDWPSCDCQWIYLGSWSFSELW